MIMYEYIVHESAGDYKVSEKKNVLQTIREQEMDRKSFLKMSGLVLLSFFGVGTIIKLLLPVNTSNQNNAQGQSSKGFGSGKYGV